MEEKENAKKLLWKIAMWEFEYRKKHTAGKSEEQLLAEGWEKDCDGQWCHKKMEVAREREFRKENHELLLKIVCE
jgi:hypothetical protein